MVYSDIYVIFADAVMYFDFDGAGTFTGYGTGGKLDNFIDSQPKGRSENSFLPFYNQKLSC